MLTTAAVPRSVRWCEGQCSVPATQATGSQRMEGHARVSWGLRWGKSEHWMGAAYRKLCDVYQICDLASSLH